MSFSIVKPQLDIPVWNGEMSFRTSHMLMLNGYKTMGELRNLSDEQILKKHGIGKKGLAEIKHLLQKLWG